MDTLYTWTRKKDRKIPRKKGRIIKSNKIERKRKEKLEEMYKQVPTENR